MKKNNEFIENLKKTYDEAIRLMDEHSSELIKANASMTAITKFYVYTGQINDIYETSKALYSQIYRSRKMLKHFDSSKINIRQIPLVSFIKEDCLCSIDVEIYKKELDENFSNFLDQYDNFEDDAFNEFLVRKLLNEAGYNKTHWYFNSSYLNELDCMLDFLLEFIEENYSPISDDIEDNEDSKNRERYISKVVKIAVWRRDLGKCVECGSQEKLEYDHIIPVAKGGSNTERNIQLLCEKCNRMKSDLIQ